MQCLVKFTYRLSCRRHCGAFSGHECNSRRLHQMIVITKIHLVFFYKCNLHFGIALWKLLLYNKFMQKKYSNKYLIETAIGLQDVDHLENSNFFINETEKYIKGEINLNDLEQIVASYYTNKPDVEDRTKEADIVSARIAQVISEDSFTFTVGQLLSIHQTLFWGVLGHPGKLRKYNFTKDEWVLDGASVTYGDYRELEMTLQYDFSQERNFSYKGLSIDQIIDHLALFVGNLWQIHVFEEGNTRTTAVFLIKYLRSLGFDVTNDTFAKNAWYFRNALVRANYTNISKGIYEDRSFLVKFLQNLLNNKHYELNNRELHVSFRNEPNENDRESHIKRLMKDNPCIKTEEIAAKLGLSVRTIKSVIKFYEDLGEIKRVNGKRYGRWEVIEK